MARLGIDPRVGEAVSVRLGPALDDLVEVMIDLGVPSLFLFGDDRERLLAARQHAEAMIVEWEAEAPDDVADLRDLLPRDLRLPEIAQSLLEGATWTRYSALPDSIFQKPDLTARALSAAPSLHGLLDDDGLVPVKGLDARPQGLFVDGLALHYHQLLRRSFGSSVNSDLIGMLLSVADESTRLRLAIDERRLRFAPEFEEYFERDYWRGPPLTDAALDDPHFVGETVHGDPNGGFSIMNPYAATSFRWTQDANLKTVEIEEMVPLRPDEAEEPLVLVRYLHAIRDTSQGLFIHCDGAVKAFTRAAYPANFTEFASRGRGTHYRKVFRLDGQIATDAWSQITVQWFRGNTLVPEYLSTLSSPPSP